MLGRLHHHISYAGFDRWSDHADWAYIALIATAVGTVILAAGVVIALRSLWDARRTRDGELVIELTRRWNEAETVESREAYSSAKPSEIVALIEKLYPLPGRVTSTTPPSDEDVRRFQLLVRWPALIETIGVLRDHGSISTEATFKMWGYSIASAWETWREPAMLLRRVATYPGTFQYFEDVAGEMEKAARRKAKRDALRKRLRLDRRPS